MKQSIAEAFAAVRERSPLVHNLTNFVVMNLNANVLLAAGASPVMAHAPDEIEEMVALAGAVVVNIGTLEHAWIESMHLALRHARRLGKPVVLDPVGAGATRFRTETIRRMLDETPPYIVRGNASEILAVAGVTTGATKGVDSTQASAEAVDSARRLSARYGCTVCVSGAVDYIVGAEGTISVHNGHPLMTKVTGVGCSATALIGAFAAVEPTRPAVAATAAMAVMGVAGERAARAAAGPGSFEALFLDEIYRLTPDELKGAARLN